MSISETIDTKQCSIPRLARKWPVLTKKQRFEAINTLCEHPEDWSEPFAWPEPTLDYEQRMDRFFSLYQLTHNSLSQREVLYHIFHKRMRNEQHRSEIIRFSARSLFLKTQSKKAPLAKYLYRKALKYWQIDGLWKGLVVEGWSISLSQLASDIDRALASDTCKTLKISNQGGVYATTLNAQPVVIKVFHAKPKLKDRWRASRAKKSWAAAVSMQGLELNTPKPLAYLESQDKSYFITEAIPGAQSARAWVKPLLHRQSKDFQDNLRGQVLESFINLYESGLYHGDTKLGNLLVTAPTDPLARRFYWIDLDSVIPTKPSARQIMRNLIQLNGSLGRGLSPAQRRAFLKDLAILYPWVNSTRTWAHIEKITRQRLNRELHRICGH